MAATGIPFSIWTQYIQAASVVTVAIPGFPSAFMKRRTKSMDNAIDQDSLYKFLLISCIRLNLVN